MITCQLQGRLGNQMFIIAATIAHALRNGVSYTIPSETLAPAIWPAYFGDRFSSPTGAFPIYEEYHEPSFNYTPIPFQEKHQRLIGYFQSEKYFKDYQYVIRRAFQPKYSEQVGERPRQIVSIHVRRGDYLQNPTHFPPVSEEYLRQAIDYFFQKGITEFMIFSDDQPWCASFFNASNFSVKHGFFHAQGNVFSDLYTMTTCDHHIISNSTFSWWGAWLGRNPDKIIIAPKVWFGPDNGFVNQTQDLIPETWIQL